jgi:hypothetical protein
VVERTAEKKGGRSKLVEKEMTEDVAYIILVTGRFHWLLEPLTYFYEKYMPVPLLFFSDRPIDGHNYKQVFPHNMAIYNEPCGQIVKRALRELGEHFVVFGYMDIWPVNPVNLNYVAKLERYMRDNPCVSRGNLWSDVDNQVKTYGELVWTDGAFSIVRLPKSIGGVGCSHLMPAIWSKDFLLEFIEDQWSFDAIELPGQYKFQRQEKWHTVGTIPSLFDICHLCYTADKTEARLSTIRNEQDRQYVRQFVPKEYTIT